MEVNVEEDPTDHFSRFSCGLTSDIQENHHADPVLRENSGTRTSPDDGREDEGQEDEGQEDDGQEDDGPVSDVYSVSMRTHSSVSKPSTATWSFHRTSVRTDSVVCSPELFSRNNVSPCWAPSTRSASHRDQSKSITDVSRSQSWKSSNVSCTSTLELRLIITD